MPDSPSAAPPAWRLANRRAQTATDASAGGTPPLLFSVKLLIVKPSSLGDIIHALFAVQQLRGQLPQAEIWWVANDSLCDLVGLCPDLHVIPFPRKALGRCSWKAFRGFLKALRANEFDAVLDFQGLLRSALITYAAKSPLRYGFSDAREGARLFYNRVVEVPAEPTHAVEKNLLLVKRFLEDQGLALPEGAYTDLPLALPEDWQSAADELLEKSGLSGRPLVAVGCASRWDSKSWPEDFFADVLKEVHRLRPDAGIWLLGSPDEAPRAEQVKALCGETPVVSLAGKTSMGALCALLKASRVLFTNDSGPMHIAALEAVPCVANFGSTNPVLTGPYGPAGRHFVVQSACPQAPCFHRECPRGDNHLCCKEISPVTVAAEILRRLGDSAPADPS
jgi:heptosyltransferase I